MSKKTSLSRWFLWASIVMLLMAQPISAQMITGEISGTVQDSSGAVIPEATITVTNEATSAVRTSSTMTNGDFVITALRPGMYRVKVEKIGFKAYERKGIAFNP